MSAIELPILVGIYDSESQALRALDKLQQAGFNYEQFGMVMCNGGLLPVRILDSLVSIGLPEEEADVYQHELEIGHVIVLVKHGGRILEAFRCMFEVSITGISASSQHQPQDQNGAVPGYSSNPAEMASHRENSEERESLRKLLRNSGLDHLL